MVVALTVAALTAVAAAVAVLAGRRPAAGATVVVDEPAVAPPPAPTPDEERDALLDAVGESIRERLDDAGLWLPDGTSVETLYAPLEQVGGDFLGTVEVDGEAVAFIGDVAGHGLDASIVALTVKEAIAGAIADGAGLDEAITVANELLRSEAPGFATLFACRLREGGRLSFVNAGHVPPLLLDGAGEELAPTGPLAGAFGHDYEESTVDVEPAMRIVAFTDGLTEAFGARGGLDESEIRAVVAEPGRLTDLHAAVVAKQPEPVRDDIAAFELTVGGTEEEHPHA